MWPGRRRTKSRLERRQRSLNLSLYFTSLFLFKYRFPNYQFFNRKKSWKWTKWRRVPNVSNYSKEEWTTNQTFLKNTQKYIILMKWSSIFSKLKIPNKQTNKQKRHIFLSGNLWSTKFFLFNFSTFMYKIKLRENVRILIPHIVQGGLVIIFKLSKSSFWMESSIFLVLHPMISLCFRRKFSSKIRTTNDVGLKS